MLTNDLQINVVGGAIAAANNTNNTSDVIDLSTLDGVLFTALITGSATNGVAKLKVETSDSPTGTFTDAGVVATATDPTTTGNALAGKLLIAEVGAPVKRYVRARRQSATGNIAFGHLLAIAYGQGSRPVADGAAVADSTYVTGV